MSDQDYLYFSKFCRTTSFGMERSACLPSELTILHLIVPNITLLLRCIQVPICPMQSAALMCSIVLFCFDFGLKMHFINPSNKLQVQIHYAKAGNIYKSR